ncbi:unnamed protein product [Cuscuta campestris]|uniref:MCAfunc domain-containing protein n=1 Tax=Cuscuta campestris TaxID=132261 RepID=A0A484KXI5_9ASTE|nr:unnamed protein product [Cuscuta campestris]
MVIGDAAANVVQLAGLSAGALIGLIVRAANNARMHRNNCKKFAQHLKMIGNLLDQLKIRDRPGDQTREPLEELEDSLRRAYVLVKSCEERSYLYLIAMGWNIVYQFRRSQEEIDRYLKIIPLIALLDNAKLNRRVEEIEMHKCEYTLEDEDMKVQAAISNPQPSRNDRNLLIKNLSRSYPNLPVNEALESESKKLKVELQQSQANMDHNECEVIQRLIEVTENVSTTLRSSDCPKNIESDPKLKETHTTERVVGGHEYGSAKRPSWREEWHADLLGCCSEPSLCVKTFFWPCGTLSKVASVATGKQTTSGEACGEIMTYSIFLACCCYTSCIRVKLRRVLNIKGGAVDDFFSHVLCCCCALVQEWREVEIRGAYGLTKSGMIPPPSQHMGY